MNRSFYNDTEYITFCKDRDVLITSADGKLLLLFNMETPHMRVNHEFVDNPLFGKMLSYPIICDTLVRFLHEYHASKVTFHNRLIDGILYTVYKVGEVTYVRSEYNNLEITGNDVVCYMNNVDRRYINGDFATGSADELIDHLHYLNKPLIN